MMIIMMIMMKTKMMTRMIMMMIMIKMSAIEMTNIRHTPKVLVA